jgi:curved DNA-binding protein CbpA
MFRLLEHRYHPDNPHSADTAKLERVRRAFEVLSKPASRQAYDKSRPRQAPAAQREPAAIAGFAGQAAEEKQKRWELLALLYSRRLPAVGKPGLTLSEVEASMGVPREELEFAFWYLQESGLLEPEHGHNRYAISAKGVDLLESRLAAE